MTETLCMFCKKLIAPATPTVCIVGGFFPASDPDFFMVDQQVLREGHVHRDCLLEKIKDT